MSDEEDEVEKPIVDLNEGGNYVFPFDKVKDMKVYGEDEKDVEFGSLLKGKKLLVFFVRQFGWYVCRDYMKTVVKRVEKYKAELAAADIDRDKNILIVGCGAAAWIKRYRDDLKLPFPVYTDPKRDLHKALALHRVESLGDLVAGKTSQYTGSNLSGMAWSAKISLQSGKIETGDGYQQGASFVINPDGTASFHYFEKYPNDHPEIEDIFRAAGAKVPEEHKEKKEKNENKEKAKD